MVAANGRLGELSDHPTALPHEGKSRRRSQLRQTFEVAATCLWRGIEHFPEHDPLQHSFDRIHRRLF